MTELKSVLALLQYRTGPQSLPFLPVQITEEQAADLVAKWREVAPQISSLTHCTPWVELTVDNRPEGEVLAANFKPRTHGYREKLVGYIGLQDYHADGSPHFFAQSDDVELDNVTHFIYLKHFDL